MFSIGSTEFFTVTTRGAKFRVISISSHDFGTDKVVLAVVD